ncbi:YajG family lipoprotein [Rheinheimera sp. MMS21-TC3]|uniref:YajG family lipoprotein n=1 Tax=Rheinheimera sp. MMS21-TC3 TaxID=3072790 RepID=UPI0028C45DBC|nr:YajG family lipoprotein [Rheinheimera sp. MMS21-TC3]WNO60538.1 YajG family lipoprotein [Rheinheimera sp. MMS21-TC3]
MRYLLVLTFLLLTACSNNPTKFILAPQAYAAPSSSLSQAQFSLHVVDSRAMPYTLKVVKKGKGYQLKTSNDLIAHLQATISQALSQQGATINSNNTTSVTIKVAQLQALVQQNTLDHTVTNQVGLTIMIKTDSGKEFTKTYSGDGNVTGPFKIDIAAVERDLRVLTEQVLGQLLQDTSWQNFLRS